MSRWVGFIDLLALRHAASIDQAAVERLLSNFFEVLRSYSRGFSPDQLTVDILSDSAVLRFASFEVMRKFYLKIRPEMFLKETYFRLGIAPGDVEIERFNFENHGNVAGTYFRGDAGMSAYAAQNALNGAGAILIRPQSESGGSAENTAEDAGKEFRQAIQKKWLVRSHYFSRDTRPSVEDYIDFAMTDAEIGPGISLAENEKLLDILEEEEKHNDGFTFFDEVYSKYAYTRGLDRFIARKYLSVFFTLLSSTDYSRVEIAGDGTEFSQLPVSLCRMFFDRRFRGIERDEDFALVLLRAISLLLEAKSSRHSGATRIRQLLDEIPELKWVCKTLSTRKPLYRKLGNVSDRVVPMKIKDMVLRGMTEQGFIY